MRITGGIAKGQQLKLPVHVKLRPTTDRVREAIFSLLTSYDCDWEKVLDLYAGTGALGIEALSRGAGWADFVDREPRCCAIIKQNLEKVGFKQNAHVYCSQVSKALTFLGSAFGVPLVPLGVDAFGQSGAREDLYRHYEIDTDAIVAAAYRALDLR